MYPLHKGYQSHNTCEAAKNAFANCTYSFQTSLPLGIIDVPVSPFDRLLYDRVSSDRGVTQIGQCAMRVQLTYRLSVKFSLPFLAGL
jgi:hypothetical protein